MERTKKTFLTASKCHFTCIKLNNRFDSRNEKTWKHTWGRLYEKWVHEVKKWRPLKRSVCYYVVSVIYSHATHNNLSTITNLNCVSLELIFIFVTLIKGILQLIMIRKRYFFHAIEIMWEKVSLRGRNMNNKYFHRKEKQGHNNSSWTQC